jgi:hypothetical protein
MKTSELAGAALDWAVSKCEGIYFEDLEDFEHSAPDYSDWATGGPIIERADISTIKVGIVNWKATLDYGGPGGFDQYGPTPLIAAMRCYVASKLGDDIEIPKEVAA